MTLSHEAQNIDLKLQLMECGETNTQLRQRILDLTVEIMELRGQLDAAVWHNDEGVKH